MGSHFDFLGGPTGMRTPTSNKLQLALRLAACLLVVRVTFTVLTNYVDYFPADFTSEFLNGRELYFEGSYQWAFYSHIIAGPGTLLFGMILLSDSFRQRFRRWHRIIGRIQVGLILLVLTPSGLWMAKYAATGWLAGAGFASVAMVTGVCTWFGWRTAMRRRFVEHRLWMWRCYLCLCSAVFLRLTAGIFTLTEVDADSPYPMAAWTSWVVPLVVFELLRLIGSRERQGAEDSGVTPVPQE